MKVTAGKLNKLSGVVGKCFPLAIPIAFIFAAGPLALAADFVIVASSTATSDENTNIPLAIAISNPSIGGLQLNLLSTKGEL